MQKKCWPPCSQDPGTVARRSSGGSQYFEEELGINCGVCSRWMKGYVGGGWRLEGGTKLIGRRVQVGGGDTWPEMVVGGRADWSRGATLEEIQIQNQEDDGVGGGAKA